MSANRLVPSANGRGFKRMPPVEGAYGGEVVVRESSAASSPHLWLDAWTYADLNARTGTVQATVHLSLAEAEVLRDQLTFLIEHHYQLED